MRRVRRGVGVRAGGEAAVRGGGVPLHPASAHLPGAWTAGLRLPALALAAARLLFAQVVNFTERRFLILHEIRSLSLCLFRD